MVLTKEETPTGSVVLVDNEMVGFVLLLHTTPSAVIPAPPSLVIAPPDLAPDVVIADAKVVLNVGRLACPTSLITMSIVVVSEPFALDAVILYEVLGRADVGVPLILPSLFKTNPAGSSGLIEYPFKDTLRIPLGISATYK